MASSIRWHAWHVSQAEMAGGVLDQAGQQRARHPSQAEMAGKVAKEVAWHPAEVMAIVAPVFDVLGLAGVNKQRCVYEGAQAVRRALDDAHCRVTLHALNRENPRRSWVLGHWHTLRVVVSQESWYVVLTTYPQGRRPGKRLIEEPVLPRTTALRRTELDSG